MEKNITFESLLVPVDFSAPSHVALGRAVQLTSGDDRVVILLHVIDPSLVSFAVDHGFRTEESVAETMRQRATRLLEQCKAEIEVPVNIVNGT